jgi:hypothetical protein
VYALLRSAGAGVADRALAESAAAWIGLRPDGKPVPSPLPQGEMTPARAAGAAALDVAIHAWDIAVATGQGSPLSAALARSLQPVAEGMVEPLRAFGAHGPALEVSNGPGQAGDTAVVLCYLGRRPDWAG